MNKYLSVFQKSRLFQGLSDDQILSLITCLKGSILEYEKNDTVFFDGGSVDFVGLIISGELQTQKSDYNGNANIVSKHYPSDVVAASACFSSTNYMPFDVVSLCECKLLHLNAAHLIRPCSNACGFHSRLIENMVNIISDRNLVLASKIDILTKRTIKEKILAFLYAQSRGAKNKRFSIPFSRRQMAEYLSINRCALSRELSSLRDQGILDFDSNTFLLK